jgi:hypothetical protein
MKKTNAVLACGLLAASLLAGCATGSKPDAMVATPVAAVHKSPSDVSIAVSGGKETSKAGASQISNDAFAQALQDSISKSGLFTKVNNGSGRYKLNAFIGKVEQPMFGFSMTVKMEVSYTLVDTQTNKPVWSQNVASSYTAGGGDAFVGTTRLRLANEGAARDNISQVLQAISALKLT